MRKKAAKCDEKKSVHVRGKSVTSQSMCLLGEMTPLIGLTLYPSRDVVLTCTFWRTNESQLI